MQPSYAKGGRVFNANSKKCLEGSGSGSSSYCCNTYKGCHSAINEGQAEFHGYLIDNLTISRTLSLIKARCDDISLTSTVTKIYNNCDQKRYPKGQVHTMGLFVYTTIWTQIYNDSNVNKKYIAVLFSEHLPLLEANDDFVTAGVKIVNLAKQLFDESTGARYAEIIKTIFRTRGLSLD